VHNGGGDMDDSSELRLLRQVLQIAQLGSWEWEVATGTIRWSDQLYRIYGFEPGSVAPSYAKFLELVHPDDRAQCEALGAQVLAEGRPIATEYRIVRPDGSVRWIESRFEPNVDASGRYVRLVGVEKDVTEKRIAGAALRESEERYRQIVEIAQEGIWLVDAEERTVFVNARMAEMLGTTVAEMLRRPIYDFIEDESRPRTRERMEQRRRGVRAHAFDLRFVRDDGGEIWTIASSAAVFDAEGRYRGVLGTFVDNTERRNAQLRATQLASIVESSNDAIFALSLEGRILTWNAGAERIYGWSTAEALGADAGRLVREARAGELGSYVEKLARGESLPLVEARPARKDGAELQVTITISRLQDERGRPVGAAVIARDVTERRRAAEALARSEARFKRLVESNLFSIVIGDGAGQIIDASDSFLALLGFGREDIRAGRLRWDTLTPPEYAKVDAAVVESVRTAGFCAPYEKEFLRKDGTRVPILMGIAATGTSEKDVEGIGFVLDLTRLKQAEEAVREAESQLRQAQKMEAIGRLAGGIAHDFNNILAAIMGYAELALRKVEAPESVRSSLLEIVASSDRAASLTRQLLAFSRKQVLQPLAALDLNSVVIDMDRMLRRLIGEDVELETHLEKDLWAVKADPSQVEQVIVNLAVNARDAMPEGGKLTIETRNVVVDARRPESPEIEPGSWVLLTVTDRGVGMDHATLARAFEPFFTTKPMGMGTGLGLSTVYGIVKQSGGHVSVSSELGRGTRFEILLQRTEGVPERWQRPTPLAASPGKETILFAEDNTTVRALVRELLETSGYKVLAASHPEEALTLASQHEGPIHVLLTDVIMPGMNGRQLHQRLLAQRPGLPVVYMSGHTDGVLQRQGALEPGTAFIQKPFTLAALSHELKKVLGVRV
jgi:two-component system cell cycle sensor histidine kinase/response regulator CckA